MVVKTSRGNAKTRKHKPAAAATVASKITCSDMTMCITFGTETKKIEKMFNFANFKNIVGIRNIAAGKSGIINELIYECEGYRTASILKSNLDTSNEKYLADNLYYEGYIGLKYINRLAQQYPCFLKTYGLYLYNDPKLQQTFEQVNAIAEKFPDKYAEFINIIPHNVFKKLPIPKKFDANSSCALYGQYAIQLEYINAPISLSTLINTQMSPYFYFVELPQIIFQIYSVLGSLSSKEAYAHNDLHIGNILIYIVPDDKHITLTYKNAVGGATIQFQTRYIVKIIDYGRNFVPEMNPIFKQLCKAPKCKPNCGVNNGYLNIFDESYDPLPTRHNTTYDCIALYNMSSRIRKYYDRLPTGHNLIGSKNDPILNILLKFKFNKVWPLTTEYVSQPYPKRKPSDFNVFNTISNISNLPEIHCVCDIYWTMFYYLHSSSIYKAYKHAFIASGHKYNSSGEINCDLEYTPTHIRPLTYSV